ncbi:MAG: signal peptidase II [Candidatus Bipolaricaulota bacterium]
MSLHSSFSLVAGIIFLDQVSKFLIHSGMGQNGSRLKILPHLYFRYEVRNPGGAFGLFPNRGYLFAIVTALVIGVLIFALATMKFALPTVRYGLSLLLGGAAGNFIDRIIHGAVIDFIQINCFPVFNVADAAIVAGTVLLIGSLAYQGIQ